MRSNQRPSGTDTRTASPAFDCRAILFDLDGVLVNSAECVERTWRVWAARHNLDVERVLAFAHGRRTFETMQLIAPELSAEDEARELEASEAMSTEGIYEIPGARELLHSLPIDAWAIVTSGIRAVAEFRLRYLRLPIPRIMICADDISVGKPDPEGYLSAAKQLGRSPSECVVIEDAPAGIDAAHNGGMRAIGMATTYDRSILSAADYIADRLTDLTITVTQHRIRIS